MLDNLGYIECRISNEYKYTLFTFLRLRLMITWPKPTAICLLIQIEISWTMGKHEKISAGEYKHVY